MDFKPLTADDVDDAIADMKATDPVGEQIKDEAKMRQAGREERLKALNERYESAMRDAIAELGDEHPVAAELQQQLDWREPALQ